MAGKLPVLWMVACAFAPALALGACEGEPARPPAAPLAVAQKAQIDDGRRLAEKNCAACHAVGATGESPNPRAPVFRTVLDRYNAGLLATELIVGVRVAHTAMPRFEFDPARADALIAYLQTLPGQGPPAPATVKTPARHEAYLGKGVPESYRGRANPFKATIGNVIEGARTYDRHCAQCHGMMGVGDGEAGERLKPTPADLSASLGEKHYRDDFFYWTIARGGADFGTAMPAFEATLSRAEIWKTVTFMRAAFAESEAGAVGKDAVAPP
jgi:mono/diheme cytochrome c family protein